MITPTIHEVVVPVQDIDELTPWLTDQRATALSELTRRWKDSLPTVWHVNSTATGGGVAEMLRPLVAYGRSAGLDVRWLVIAAPTDFFDITKRVDNGISGVEGDCGALGSVEQRAFREMSDQAAGDLAKFIRPGDIVVLHDPQTAGLCEAVADLGAIPVWRAHNGSDVTNRHTARSNVFLSPFLEPVRALIASRNHFHDRIGDRSVHMNRAAIAPFIDPNASKNVDLAPEAIAQRLRGWGLVDSDASDHTAVPGLTIVREKVPTMKQSMVVQVSRWDAVKGMLELLDSFTVAADRHTLPGDTYLTLAGPQVDGVEDDPEAADYFAQCVQRYAGLPARHRARIQLVCLPVGDLTANALAVNALQRHARLVTQNSRSEGFGLTVTEAMWKAKQVLATAVGGIELQIPDNTVGCTVPFNDCAGSMSNGLARMLGATRSEREQIGAAAQERVRANFLPDSHMHAEFAVLHRLVAAGAAA